MLGSHKSTLSEKIQLTEVPEEEQKLLYAKGKSFTHRHWRVLSRIKEAGFLKELLKRTLEEQLSVAELERALDVAGIPKVKKQKTQEKATSIAWNPPLSSQGTRLFFKNSSIDLSQLSSDRKMILKAELEKVLLILEQQQG